MMLVELTADQRRQLIDAKQVYSAWRTTRREFTHSYRGSMRWRRIKDSEYLYRIFNGIEKSLGPRSNETERIKNEYTGQRTRLRRRLTALEAKIKGMSRLNRASDLGRIPDIASRILRKLDEQGLLGNHLFVVGTHSLYAYEAAAGVRLDSGLIATGDVDLLWDARRRLSLALTEDVRQEGVLGLLKRVDRSFTARRRDFRAVNDEGYLVDLIRPMERDEGRSAVETLGGVDQDLHAAALAGLHWLLSAPKFEEISISEDGRPVWMSCIDPRVFALHKYWISRRDDREPVKKKRDIEQAKAVAYLAVEYLNLPFNAKDLTALPMTLVKSAKDLIRAVRTEEV